MKPAFFVLVVVCFLNGCLFDAKVDVRDDITGMEEKAEIEVRT
jgi:hypothetical protein